MPLIENEQMYRASLRQRREVPLQWDRFLTHSKEHDEIVLKERPNPVLFRMIKDKHSFEWNPETVEAFNRVEVNMENSGWSRRVILRQNKIEEFPEAYKGCKTIGRAYGSAFTNLHSKIVNTLFRDTHLYIDAVNCFPTILYEFHSHLTVDALKCYVTERDETFYGFYKSHGIPKKDVKRAITSMIGSCPRLPRDFGLGNGKEEAVRVFSEHPFILQLQADLITVANDIKMRYPDFYEGIVRHSRNSDHAMGVVLSMFCQDIEDTCMRTVLSEIKSMDDDAGEWADQFICKYDGILFPKRYAFGDEVLIERIQSKVREVHGIALRFDLKDMSVPSDCYADCIPEITGNAYKVWKDLFERRYVKFAGDVIGYGLKQLDGQYKILSYGAGGAGGEFGMMTQEENQDFIKQWIVDPDKIIYRGMDFAPPPLQIKHGYYNSFRGLRAANLMMTIPDDEIAERVQPWLTHIGIMTGHDPSSEEYLNKHIAYMVQNPGLKTGVVVFVRSIQGTGKDQMFKFLMSLFGHSYCYRDTNVQTLRASKSARLHNKLLVCLGEVNYKDFRDHAEFIKDWVDREYFDVEDKYVKAFQSRCLSNVFMFTNQFDPMGLTMDDRRMFVVEADGRYGAQNQKLNAEYHGPFAKYIKDDRNVVAVYEYYKNMDLGDFNPQRDHPRTKIMEKMASQTTNHAAWFLRREFDRWLSNSSPTDTNFRRLSDTSLRISNATFYDCFGNYVQEMKIPNMESKQRQGQFIKTIMAEAGAKMLKYCPSGIEPIQETKAKIGGTMVRAKIFYIPAIQQFISESCSDDTVDGDGDDGAEETKMETTAATPKKGSFQVQHNRPGHYPSYVVKDKGEIVFASDDLEEINRYVGEAYIKIRDDGTWVLVNPFRKMEIVLDDEYKGDHGKTKLEMKYPWYRKSRVM